MNESDTKKNESDTQKAARTEQLWYAGTTMAMNFFLISQHFPASMTFRWVLMSVSLALSLYAVALIANRARKYEADASDIGYRKPAFRDVFANLWMVIRQTEGALFYVLLVIVSCTAVLATNVAAILKPC